MTFVLCDEESWVHAMNNDSSVRLSNEFVQTVKGVGLNVKEGIMTTHELHLELIRLHEVLLTDRLVKEPAFIERELAILQWMNNVEGRFIIREVERNE